MNSKVVVTGMGVVTPVGCDVETFWKSLCEGRSGIGPLERFPMDDYPSRIAGTVKEELEPDGIERKHLRRLDLYAIYAIEAANQAWKQSGLDVDNEDPARCGVVIGSGIGGIETIAEQVVKLHEGGPRKVSPLMIPKGLSNMAAGNIATHFGLRGPNHAIVTACASATHSLGSAARYIRGGIADVMVAGGSEAPLVPFSLAGFGAMKALSTRNDEPERASRPFDKDRDGFVIGEGAGVVVLESEEHAKARGAHIFAELAGFGESCDAYHITSPRPDGTGAAQAMQMALAEAQLNPGDVDHFNAHGTSTYYNDMTEAKSLEVVFGDKMPLVTSTKSMTGHTLGAAGTVEGIAAILAIRDNVVHPTVNYETPDPECPVNLAANVAHEIKVTVAMSNSLGFGGHNSSVIFREYA